MGNRTLKAGLFAALAAGALWVLPMNAWAVPVFPEGISTDGESLAGKTWEDALHTAEEKVKKQADAGTKETKEVIAALDERLKRVESGWGIDYKHDAVLGLCYMGAAYMSQHYERTVETAVLGATYVGNSYLANTF